MSFVTNCWFAFFSKTPIINRVFNCLKEIQVHILNNTHEKYTYLLLYSYIITNGDFIPIYESYPYLYLNFSLSNLLYLKKLQVIAIN